MANEGLLSQYIGLLQAGMDPDQVREMIEEQKAMKFASMSQDAQRSYALNRGYGQGIQNLMTGLGMKPAEDPVLRQASMLRQLEKQFDLTTVEGWKQYSKALQEQGMGDLARQAHAKGLELEKTGAEIASTKALAAQRGREKETADPKLVFIRENAKNFQPSSIDKFLDSGKYADLVPAGKETTINFGPEAERISAALFGVPFARLTKEQASAVDNTIAERDKATKGTTVNVGLKMDSPKDVSDFRSKLLGTVENQRRAYEAADLAITAADEAINNNNFAAAANLASSLSKASGDSQISNKDVAKYGGDPSLIGSVADVASRLARGTPTKDTLNQLKKLANILKAKNEESIKQEFDVQRKIAKRSGMKDEDIEIAFSGVLRQGGAKQARKTRSGVTYTVED